MTVIAPSLKRIQTAIRGAAKRAGRISDEITLVAASKRIPVERIEEAAKNGLRIFGENRVQEAVAKFKETGLRERINSLHLIGPLQTNKVKRAVGFFDLIHSIDSVHLAEKVAQEAGRRSRRQAVLVQVNVSGEESKHGISVKEAPDLINMVRRQSHLSLLGLMTIPPYHSDPERSRPYFSMLRELGDGMDISRFSMGMSADFEVAIEEGATWVRIGTALFGQREG
ncbi:MAG: YggS family pyridoxal phosphate-dependent enzyme [Nitrospira sp.]|nr:YggS family pyridoxal phosphate-dependent enzyme [Candidatus Manganitrophaceae bacterium]HIL33800.1 YggS family pyridoxal phosphate-dependent enzyme [Candidatus Manganitrophaceae bacterium]